MMKRVVGYSSVIFSVVIGILALASLSEKPVSYGTSSVLVVVSIAAFALSWVTLLGRSGPESAAPPTA